MTSDMGLSPLILTEVPETHIDSSQFTLYCTRKYLMSKQYLVLCKQYQWRTLRYQESPFTLRYQKSKIVISPNSAWNTLKCTNLNTFPLSLNHHLIPFLLKFYLSSICEYFYCIQHYNFKYQLPLNFYFQTICKPTLKELLFNVLSTDHLIILGISQNFETDWLSE